MGVEYLLVKPRTGAAYELGKAATRPPAPDWGKRLKGLDPLRDAIAWQTVMQPSDRAIWSIGSESCDCELTVLSKRWSADDLAAVINVALFQTDVESTAHRIAQDLLEWAGDDAVVLIPDTLGVEHVAKRIGTSIARPRIEQSVHDDKFQDAFPSRCAS